MKTPNTAASKGTLQQRPFEKSTIAISISIPLTATLIAHYAAYWFCDTEMVSGGATAGWTVGRSSIATCSIAASGL